MNPCYIDIHCHLDDCKPVKHIIQRAQLAQVNIICTQGTDTKSNSDAVKLATYYPEVRVCLGLYPITALSLTDKEIDTVLATIEENAQRIVAIGEVGMDFKEDLTRHERQKAIFTKVVNLALKLDKPLIIHSRKAELECIELLEQLGAKKVIMHCFSGKWSLAQRIIANGWYLTVPTSVTRSEQFQRYAQEVPLSQLFCETDAPFLHPDKTVLTLSNEPANVVVSYEAIAKAKNLSLPAVRDALYENYRRLFL